MHEAGCSGLVHWDDPEGWDGEGGGKGGPGWGTHVYPWLIHVNVWQKPPQYCKVISLQLKLKKKKKKETNSLHHSVQVYTACLGVQPLCDTWAQAKKTPL